MSRAWLGLGSNINAHGNIRTAIEKLRKDFAQVHLSPVYISAAVGFEGADFINLVARVETLLGPLQLRTYLRRLEDSYGRRRDVPKYSDRTLDIDILLYDDLVLRSPLLDIPRAEILKFSHVLKPLADLDPGLIHPTENRCMAELWESMSGEGSKLVLLQPFD